MDEKKEQAKVRERILKVFKARAQSPGGGPAIVINNGGAKPRRKCAESLMQSTEFPKYKLPDSDDDFLISDTNATPIEETMEKGKPRKQTQSKDKKQDEAAKSHRHGSSSSSRSRHREKRRKSRAERNKERAQKQQQVNPHEREEFRKHVKKAREITKQSNHNESLHSDDQLFVAITQNRLTRQTGIYNQGKKSTRLYRDPLRVSERVTAAVEEEVKMIVDPSESPNLHHTSMESLPPPALSSTPVISDRRVSDRRVSDRRTRSSSRSCKSLTRKRESESEAAQRSHPKSADYHSSRSSGHSAQIHDMQDLSVQLVKSLNIKQLFPGGDYAAEIKCDLQKLMKSNSAGKEEVISAESVRQYMVSSPHEKNEANVSRPVVSKQTPVTQQKPAATSHVISHDAHAASRLHHATACVQHPSCTTSPDGGTPHHSQDQVMLLEVPQTTTASNPIPGAPNSLDNSSRPLVTDALEFPKASNSLDNSSTPLMTDNALEFLHFAETMAVECERQQQAKADESGRLSHTQAFSHEVQHKRSDDSYHTDYYPSSSSYNIGTNRTSHSTFGSMRGESLSSYSNDRCKVEWQPDGYHEAVMSLKQRYRMDEDYDTRHSALYNKANSPTDMLDYIGVEHMEVTGPSPSLPDPYYLRRHKKSTDFGLRERHHASSVHHYKPHTISQFEKCESDSESPVWRPKFSVSPIRKPQLDSPGPPELYPQKMF